jgi:protein-disulfide isomerase
VTGVKEVKVEVIGPEPACMRCQAARKAVEKAAEKLDHSGIAVKMEKANIISREIVSRYGVLVSPAIAINGIVKIMGRVPKQDEIEKLAKEAAK